MIPVVFNAATAYLLDDAPSWDSDFALAASITALTERGLTGRETRRVTGDTLRLEARFTCLLTSTAAIVALRNSLQSLAAGQVLCPLWPAGFTALASAPVTADWYAVFNADGSFNCISAAAALQALLSGLPDATAYPLMVGFLKSNPEPTLLSDSLGSVEFDFADSDNYPLTPVAFAAPAGLPAAGGVRPLFPFDAEWSTVPVSGDSEVDIDRRQIGNLRTLATAYYTQRGRRKVTQSFKLQNSDPFNLLRFFQDMGGEMNNFWLGAAISETSLTADVTATAATLSVDNGAALGTNSFVLLNDNTNRVPLAVASVVGNVWNLAAAPGMAFGADITRIESLVLARFDDLKLELSFSRPDLASATLKFCELPWETNAVAGETYGTTMGALPPTATFFLFTMTTPSGATTYRFTNFERNLSDGVNTWLSAPMEYDNIEETADLKRNQTTITSRNFAGNPLALLFPLALEWPLMLQIFEGDVTPATSLVANLRCYFYGEVAGADLEPPFITAQCSMLSHIFDRQLPRRLYQRTDNWVLFEPANGLLPASWLWNAVVVSYSATAATLVVNAITSTNPATLVAHWFAGGYLIVTAAAGGKQQVRMISDNTAPAAGQTALQLSTPLTTAPTAGDVVALYPGYDGQASTAKTKFNNYQQKFGGFPFIPIGNPTVLRITQPTGGGKK